MLLNDVVRVYLLIFGICLVWSVVCGEGWQNDGDNQTVQTEGLSEDENKNDSDVDVLLGVGTDTGITSNTDAETGSEGWETAAETWGEVLVAVESTVLPLGGGRDACNWGLVD